MSLAFRMRRKSTTASGVRVIGAWRAGCIQKRCHSSLGIWSLARSQSQLRRIEMNALTAMSPLQYQNYLRLRVARERMLKDGIDATSAAYEVGYESVSQFNRSTAGSLANRQCAISRRSVRAKS